VAGEQVALGAGRIERQYRHRLVSPDVREAEGVATPGPTIPLDKLYNGAGVAGITVQGGQ